VYSNTATLLSCPVNTRYNEKAGKKEELVEIL
jgi:hypothetical protein